MRPAGASELAVPLNRASTTALPQQLVAAVRQLIRAGVLRPGDAMPATRAWAPQLGVSRGTIVTAYEQLIAEGYLVAARGAATLVNPALAQAHPDGVTGASRGAAAAAAGAPARAFDAAGCAHPARTEIDMLPGQTSAEHLSTPAWRRAWRDAAAGEFEAAPLAGAPEFLAAVSEYFRQMRGLARAADQYLATAGGREGLALIVLTLASNRGGAALRVGVESPGYPSLRLALRRLGCALVPLPVDGQGLRTDALPSGPASPDLVIVTPSHQYPLGGTLPIARRLELLEWARREDVLIVEDDFDSELRYVGRPLPTLTALDDANSVALLGTFATTVAPGLGIGTLCVPVALRTRLLAARADLGSPVSTVVQRAFAHYLSSGELARRAARMRRIYRQRRAAVLDAFAGAEHLTVAPMDGGLHAVIGSPHSDAAMLTACARAGVRVEAGGDYWNRAEPEPPARTDVGGSIVIGFAHLSDAQLTEGLRRLRSVL